jgi:hypothetical protein
MYIRRIKTLALGTDAAVDLSTVRDLVRSAKGTTTY